jgi:hypothetical protein
VNDLGGDPGCICDVPRQYYAVPAQPFVYADPRAYYAQQPYADPYAGNTYYGSQYGYDRYSRGSVAVPYSVNRGGPYAVHHYRRR